MRICCVSVLMFMTIGCANKHPGESLRAQRYEDISASSLVFTPPVAMGEEHDGLVTRAPALPSPNAVPGDRRTMAETAMHRSRAGRQQT